jgi:hypothetical protein
MIAAFDNTDQSALKQILPAVIPGQTERVLLATFNAREQAKTRAAQIKIQGEADEALVREMKTALDLDHPDQLVAFKNLQAVFNRLPASVQADIFRTPSAGDRGSKSGGNG